jgi:hypothetical protein
VVGVVAEVRLCPSIRCVAGGSAVATAQWWGSVGCTSVRGCRNKAGKMSGEGKDDDEGEVLGCLAICIVMPACLIRVVCCVDIAR